MTLGGGGGVAFVQCGDPAGTLNGVFLTSATTNLLFVKQC